MAALMKWRPGMLRPFGWDDLDEWFDEPDAMSWEASDLAFPKIEAYEKDGHYVVKADLPGMNPKDVHVTVEGDHLLIRGERKEDKETRRKNFYRREVFYGSFERAVPLPEEVKTEGLKAKVHDGVLEIKAPCKKGHLNSKKEIQIEKTA